MTTKLAQGESVRPAVNAAYTIGTDMLRDIAGAVLLFGIVILFAAALAGPKRPAVAIRRATAPWLRNRPGVAYGVLTLILLLIVLWGPIPATRKVIPVLIIFALAFLGLHALRVQTAKEFPEANEGDTSHALRSRASGAVDSVRRRTSHASHNDPDPSEDRLQRLERLSAMHDSGSLTDEEFAAEKASVLGS